MAFLALPKDHKEMYEAIGYREKLDAVDEGIRRYVLIPGGSRFHSPITCGCSSGRT